ncbi:unnamed protein product, partial [Brassica oleracea var. botrytis]
FRIYGVLYIFIYHTYNIYTHIYTSVSLTGDLTSLAQLRLSLWFVTSLPQFVTPLHSVSRASACGSSRLRFSLQFVTPCLWFVTPPPRHYMRHVSSFASSVPPLLQLFFTPDCLHTRSVSRDVCTI